MLVQTENVVLTEVLFRRHFPEELSLESEYAQSRANSNDYAMGMTAPTKSSSKVLQPNAYKMQ